MMHDWKLMPSKFRKGDRVKCIEPQSIMPYNGSDSHYPLGAGWDLDKEFEVSSVSRYGMPSTPVYCYWGMSGGGIYEQALCLVTPATPVSYINVIENNQVVHRRKE